MSTFPEFDFKQFEKKYSRSKTLGTLDALGGEAVDFVKYTTTSNNCHKIINPPHNNDNGLTSLKEEQAAIIEYDSRIPNDWAKAIVKTQTRRKPATISNNKWDEIQNALKTLLPQLETIILHDWKLSDIFGCHPIVPEKRFDVMGLLMLLNEGDRIIEVSRDVIRIQNNRGVVNSYSHQFCNYQTERSFLYEIESNKNGIASVETEATRMKKIIEEFNNKALLELVEKAATNSQA